VFHEPTKQLTIALVDGHKFEVHDVKPDGRGRYQLYEQRGDGNRLVLDCDEQAARKIARDRPPARRSFS
jgi:hypothetical protein